MAAEQFVEVADRVWVARHEWFDLNITLVGSDRTLAVRVAESSPRGVMAPLIPHLNAFRK